MSEQQLSPEALSTQAENELICEKLLGWKRRKCFSPYDGRFMGYDFIDGERPTTAPPFTTWSDAGLILQALSAQTIAVESVDAKLWACRIYKSPAFAHGESGPAAIRAAALEYIRRLS